MNENSTVQQKQWRNLTEQERVQWGGIEPSPMRLNAVRPRQTQMNTGYDELQDDENLYPTRQPSSTRRYHANDMASKELTRTSRRDLHQQDRYDDINVYIRRSRPQQQAAPRQHMQSTQTTRPTRLSEREQDNDEERETEQAPRPRQHVQRSHFHWLWILGIGMIVMLLLWIGGSLVVIWWQNYQDDVKYGHPRTYQTDARVGHNDAHTPSHFLALNLNRQVEVIEFPGGDVTKAKVYIGPTLLGQESDLDIVTVSFKDVNGDGKPDMILDVANAKYVYINDNGMFRPLHADEHVTM